jgi:hypothetical protein
VRAASTCLGVSGVLAASHFFFARTMSALDVGVGCCLVSCNGAHNVYDVRRCQIQRRQQAKTETSQRTARTAPVHPVGIRAERVPLFESHVVRLFKPSVDTGRYSFFFFFFSPSSASAGRVFSRIR